MKKAILKEMVSFRFMMDLNIDVKKGKINRVDFTQQEIEFFKGQMLKKEYMGGNSNNTMTFNTDVNLTTIGKYDDFYIIIQNLNCFTTLSTNEVSYYKLPIKKF